MNIKDKIYALYLKHNQKWVLAALMSGIVNTLSNLVLPYSILVSLFEKKVMPKKPLLKAPLKNLEQKYYKYLQLIRQAQDEDGFVEADTCDSLLFTGLSSAGGAKVSIGAAINIDRYWQRRPTRYKQCWSPEGKENYEGSTISRDMLMGLMWHIWKSKDLKLAEMLYKDGKKRYWIMGEGNFTRILFTPALQSTLAEMIYRLGGKNRFLARRRLQSWPDGLQDYELHLQMLHIALRGDMMGYITESMAKIIVDAQKREPNNALASVLDSLYLSNYVTPAAHLLLREDWWPSDRLPTSADRASHWLPERKYHKNGKINPDWLPSDAGKTHSGGDFLFCAKLLLDHSQK
jgi:hypothetical protein